MDENQVRISINDGDTYAVDIHDMNQERIAVNDEANDRAALTDIAKKLSENGCSIKTIADTMHISEDDVRSLLEDRIDIYESRGRNKEYYPDPTYYKASRRVQPHSRRYQLVGLIRKMAEMAGFEVVDRIVLKDKATGEVLR